MSVYVDVRTNKWFNTKAELLAFQRERVLREQGKQVPPPPSDTDHTTVPTKREDPSDAPPDFEDAPVKTETLSIDDMYSVKGAELQDGKIAISLSVDEMKEYLKETGLDGRTLRGKTEEEITELYFRRAVAFH